MKFTESELIADLDQRNAHADELQPPELLQLAGLWRSHGELRQLCESIAKENQELQQQVNELSVKV